MMTDTTPSQPPVTDSPWFWVGLFCLAALAVLLVAQGQVDRRQTRIERQTQGRQRAAEMAATGEAATEMSTPGNTVITIEPLFVLLVLAAVVSGIMFWRGRRMTAGSKAKGRNSDSSS